jgi:RNA polymerase sigma-70 factor (ECF subfamily)
MASSEELAHLLARCALRDRQAFEILYRETSAQLFGLVLRIVRDQDLASDVLQQAYLKIWDHAGDYRPDKAQPMTWIGAIVRNQAIDMIRRNAHQPIASDPVDELHWLADDAAGPQEIVDQVQQNRALHECLDQLEEKQRQALLLAYFNGMTHAELAQYLDKPLGTVKSWVRRGLLRLKKCLDER